MAAVTAQLDASPPPPPPQPRAFHGKKRAAESPLSGEQRLTKRFDRLQLDTSAAAAPLCATATAAPTSTPTSARRPHAQRAPADDAMLVEDTPHRVYIHDLAAELSDVESDDDHPIFLSDIERHLAKIPRHVLVGPPPRPTEHNQVVLYNVPASLTVPEARDSVRKAIVEARQRIRDKQASPVVEPERVVPGRIMPEDPDAMDLD
jgi:hypothetical protein